MSFWLNAAGLFLGFAGSVVIFFYGVPRNLGLTRSIIMFGAENPDALRQIALHKFMEKLGISLLTIGFGLQFTGLMIDRFHSTCAPMVLTLEPQHSSGKRPPPPFTNTL